MRKIVVYTILLPFIFINLIASEFRLSRLSPDRWLIGNSSLIWVSGDSAANATGTDANRSDASIEAHLVD